MSYVFRLIDASRGGARGELVGVIFNETLTATYTDKVTVTVSASYLKEVKNAIINAHGGYVAVPSTISGRAIDVKLYYVKDPGTTSGSNNVLTEVVSGTDVSGTTLTILAIGAQ